jgi:hypothetical protein
MTIEAGRGRSTVFEAAPLLLAERVEIRSRTIGLVPWNTHFETTLRTPEEDSPPCLFVVQ